MLMSNVTRVRLTQESSQLSTRADSQSFTSTLFSEHRNAQSTSSTSRIIVLSFDRDRRVYVMSDRRTKSQVSSRSRNIFANDRVSILNEISVNVNCLE